MKSERVPPYAGIRPVAIAVIRNGSMLLVREYRSRKGKRYYRPLGGAIHFGERAAEAVRRGFREEFGAVIENVRHRAILENIFEREGQPAHWIVFVLEEQFVDRSYCARERTVGAEGDGERIEAVWIDISQPLGGRLCPEDLLELLTARAI